jgi:ATP-dependent helicase HepA
MLEIKKGCYVRCPIDEEKFHREFILGQVFEVDENLNIAKVFFHDIYGLREFYEDIPHSKVYNIPDLRRCEILTGSRVIIKLKRNRFNGEIVEKVKDDSYYNMYYVKILDSGYDGKIVKVPEYCMEVSFTRADFNPLFQLKEYEFHNPFWFKKRIVVSEYLSIIENAPYGVDILLGARAHLYPHQIDTIINGLAENPCRIMLADEVGLGKTIEAIVILCGIKKKYESFKALIVVPDSLMNQWLNELSIKFWLEAKVWNSYMSVFDFMSPEIVILPISYLDQFIELEFENISKYKLCIVDEAHKLLKDSKVYSNALKISKSVENFILISATPIKERVKEFLDLLILLNPRKYENYSLSAFKEIIRHQIQLEERLYLLNNDLQYFKQGNLCEHYKKQIKQLNDELLHDSYIDILVEQLDCNSEDQGLEKINHILSYIPNKYMVDQSFYVHRRENLNTPMPKRCLLKSIDYEMASAGDQFYEQEVYELLIDYLEKILKENSSNRFISDYIRLFLMAMFSSPFALKDVFLARLNILKGNNYVSDEKEDKEYKSVDSIIQITQNIPSFDTEENAINNLLKFINLWENATKAEINNIKELYDNPFDMRGRFALVFDYISQELYDKKLLIFSHFSSTIQAFSEMLKNFYGEDSVSLFYKGMSVECLEQSVIRFQTDPNCRFMLCDELGGEGRNFQIADAVVHIDLPFYPSIVEQRIGRLDRIGRQASRDVFSVAIYSKHTIEEQIFKIFNDALHIFDNPISGIEIALDDIQQEINNAIISDLRYGLIEVSENVKEYYERIIERLDFEILYETNKKLDRSTEQKINEIIARFDEDGGKELSRVMLSWADSIGLIGKSDYKSHVISFDSNDFRRNIKQARNALFNPNFNIEKIIQKSKKQGKIVGTFLRDEAVKNESLIFFAPNNEIFDAIIENARECARGRCTAFIQSGISSNWCGFLFTFKVTPNYIPLLENDYYRYHYFLKGYISKGFFNIFVGLNEILKEGDLYDLSQKAGRIVVDDKIDEELLAEEIKNHYENNLIHIGKRHTSNYIYSILWFIQLFPPKVWGDIVDQAYRNALGKIDELVHSYIDLKKAEHDFEKLAVSQEYDCKFRNILIECLRFPKIILDSAVFCWLVKKNE